MTTLLEEIEAEIVAVKTTTAKENVGTVREIGDGVAKIEGLTRAKLNEMLDFGHGVTGLALNLEETEVGAIILGDYTQINEGDEVRATGKLLQVPVGKGLLGRVVNMGPSAVVRHRGLTILLTSIKMAPFDLAQWRSQGVEPKDLRIIGVKAAVGHRAAYGKIASGSFTVSSSGPCTGDLTRLPYKRLRRPVYPLDSVAAPS